MIVLFAHVRTGRWASVMPAKLAETLGLTETIRAIPIVAPEAVHTIGLVVPAREPMTPLTAALVAEAQRLAPELDAGERAEGMADPQRAEQAPLRRVFSRVVVPQRVVRASAPMQVAASAVNS